MWWTWFLSFHDFDKSFVSDHSCLSLKLRSRSNEVKPGPRSVVKFTQTHFLDLCIENDLFDGSCRFLLNPLVCDHRNCHQIRQNCPNKGRRVGGRSSVEQNQTPWGHLDKYCADNLQYLFFLSWKELNLCFQQSGRFIRASLSTDWSAKSSNH